MKVFLPIRAEGRNRLCNPSKLQQERWNFPGCTPAGQLIL